MITGGSSVTMREITSQYAVLNLFGPKARDVLASVTDDDVSNAAFPYLAVREIEIGLGRALAARGLYLVARDLMTHEDVAAASAVGVRYGAGPAV